MAEVAPIQILDSVEKLEETYRSFSTALEAIDWQGGMIAKDAAATSATVRLASDEIERAQTDLGDFIDDECQVEIENVINKLPNVGTTLPDPVIQADQLPKLNHLESRLGAQTINCTKPFRQTETALVELRPNDV